MPFVLFLLTGMTTFLIYALQLPLKGESPSEVIGYLLKHRELQLHMLLYAASIMGILTAHEMGHYVVARWRRVDQSLPYFIPFPTLFGTLGAVIFMRSMPRTRQDLFDVAIAGPLAGLMVAVPLAIYGLANSSPIDPSTIETGKGIWFGNSLLFLLLEHYFSPAGDLIVLHPAAFAAWAGLLVTSLNLIPAGQLDGGHIVYAVFGRHHRFIAIFVPAALLGLGIRLWYPEGFIWLLWGTLLLLLGRRHPPVERDREGLGPGRKVLAGVMVLIFVLTFIPMPVQQL